MGTNVKKNIFYSYVYQFLAIIIPLAVSPYIARVLGSERIGVYSYTYSIVHYFEILAVLGVANYGIRNVAKVRDDCSKLKIIFWSIFSIQFMMLLISFVLYMFFCIIRHSDYMQVEFCQSLFILASGLDIVWFFIGKESFKFIALRNGFIKVLNACLIFLFVKCVDDLWIYTLIMSGSTLLSQLIQWPFLIKEIGFQKVKFCDSKKHIKGILVLFIPILATSIFVYMDKIMIGVFSNMSETGFYENSDKILSVPKSFIYAVGAVMLPHAANMLSKGNLRCVQENIQKTMFFVLFFAFASLFGLMGIAPIFSTVFWGDDFANCSMVISVLSVSIIFSCFGNVIRTQYLIPKECDKDYTISLIFGAVVNLIVNYLLIAKYGAVGAAIGTISAEFVLCTYQTWSVRKDLKIIAYVARGCPFLFIGIIMAVMLRFFQYFLSYSVVHLLLLIFVGGMIYITLSVFYMKSTPDKWSNQMFLSIKSSILNRLYRVKDRC